MNVTIGGVPAVIQYAGAASGNVAGIMELNVVVPSTASGNALLVVVQVGNAISQGGITIAVAAGGRIRTRIRDDFAGDLGFDCDGPWRCINVRCTSRQTVVFDDGIACLGVFLV